jgi:hypothetical protein
VLKGEPKVGFPFSILKKSPGGNFSTKMRYYLVKERYELRLRAVGMDEDASQRKDEKGARRGVRYQFGSCWYVSLERTQGVRWTSIFIFLTFLISRVSKPM